MLQVFKKGTNTLTEAADATREMLDEQPGWSLGRLNCLRDEISNIYVKMSTEIHYPDTLETGWCVGGRARFSHVPMAHTPLADRSRCARPSQPALRALPK